MPSNQASNQAGNRAGALPTVLESLVTARRGHLGDIAKRISHVNPSTLAPSTRSIFDALHGQRNRFIMECKASSPSLGRIRHRYFPGDIARVYSRYASAISVLCEPERFDGDYDHLATVAASTHLPVLCKDFIIDEVQVVAARYYGADAILLMLSVLDDADYARLAGCAARLGLDVLTEVIDEHEVARALRLGARIIGINHRNLHDLSIDLTRSARLAALVPDGCAVVAESGIRDFATVRALSGHANGYLVGSQLAAQPDIDRAARALVFGENKVCGITRPGVAQAARAAGAVYGGLIFEPGSPRNVSRETSVEIRAAESGLDYVAVSRRSSGWDALPLDGIAAVQIHAPYQGSLAAELELVDSVRRELAGTHTSGGLELWRAVSMTEPHCRETTLGLLGHVDRLVLDSGNGGTGQAFDWSQVPQEVKQTALLAGGLRPGWPAGLSVPSVPSEAGKGSNLAEALDVGAAGLDLNSGLETGAGTPAGKDAGLITRAFAEIRSYCAVSNSTSPEN